MAKRNITKNPDKFAPPNFPLANYPKIVSDIVQDLKEKEDDSWSIKILKDIKNKGIQNKALETRTQTIVRRLNTLGNTTTPPPQPPSRTPSVDIAIPPEITDQEMHQADPLPWMDTEEYKQNRQLWINSASETFEKISPYLQPGERQQREELMWEAADICTLQDKDLLQLQSASSLTDSNKKRELENMRKTLIDKEYQLLAKAFAKQEASNQKDEFEDYLTMKDFDYYVQHAKDQLSNPSVPQTKKDTLKTIIKDAEKWQPKHRVDDDGSILPDSPPPSPAPKRKVKTPKKNENTQKAADLTRKGNTPNTRRLQTLLNEMNEDNGAKIMKEIHRISNQDKLGDAKKQLVKDKPKNNSPSYAQTAGSKNPKNPKDPRKDGAGGWKTTTRTLSQPKSKARKNLLQRSIISLARM
ncbi:hypothetical protein AMATHDRAFT_11407 [Amanita thiersii Skay4041]|uniref:Uncharacterized protein n=1 Tax=Amanita thiersii Skay4041 TaxID=703135 RepID=A0A2A9N917_9AGAR|nr:hypothetical protein AMATHDRAFT_11407 [Amanita thiersii Skay4041]